MYVRINKKIGVERFKNLLWFNFYFMPLWLPHCPLPCLPPFSLGFWDGRVGAIPVPSPVQIPGPDLPSTPSISFSDMMLWQFCLWSLLKFLIRSLATIQALSRLTGRVEAARYLGTEDLGDGLAPLSTPSPGKSPSFLHLLSMLSCFYLGRCMVRTILHPT